VSDIFNEVDEEVRREQLKKLWERYSALILTVAVIIVAAVGGWRGYQWWEAKQAAAAGAAFEAAVALSDQNKHAEAEAAFTKLAQEAPRGYRTIAHLRAAIEAAYRDPKAAVGLLDAIAADTSVGQGERDLATLRAAMLQVEATPFDELKRKLEPIAAPGRVYRHNARELLALAALKVGDNAAAKQWLDAIITDVETPQSLRGRAETLMALVPAAKS
jgi:hypothetical protein